MRERYEPIVDKCSQIIEDIMHSEDMPSDEGLSFKIRLSVEEAVTNIVAYAYERGDGWIEAGTSLDGCILSIILKDAGKPFNPLLKPDPDISLSAEDRKIGGLGIYLCKQLMDSIEYGYEDGCNILTMKIKTN